MKISRNIKSLIIIGAGGHSRVVQDIIRKDNEFKIHAILDDSFNEIITEGTILYAPVSYLESVNIEQYYFVVAIGDNATRKRIINRLAIPKESYATLIHPQAIISKSSQIGEGTVVMPNAVVNARTTIGCHCIINTTAVVEHDNLINDFVHISPGSILSGTVTIDEGAHLGSGTTVIPGKKIGSWCLLGAGSVVTRDVPRNVTAVGVPAKIIKE